MQDKINISEEDIFKFVLNPDSLDKDKHEYLANNQSRFAKEIEYCKKLNSESDESVENVANQIISRIELAQLIELFPSVTVQESENGIKLAAASSSMAVNKPSTSFSDEQLNYLIRLVSSGSQSLLYFFTRQESKKQYRIKFFPSEKEYLVDYFSQPIEILDEPEIQKIVIL